MGNPNAFNHFKGFHTFRQYLTHDHGDFRLGGALIIAQFYQPGIAPVLGAFEFPQNGASGLTARSADIREEKKGPSVSAPQGAIDGFLRGAGLSSIDQAVVKTDPKKGDFYVAYIDKPGRAAEEIIANVMPGIIRAFSWPTSMRSGYASMPKGSTYGGVEGKGHVDGRIPATWL